MAQKRIIITPEGSTPLEEKFINCIMKQGKKSTAQKIFNNCLNEIESKGHKDSKKLFERAIENVKPTLEVKAKRIGGAVYQIPREVKPKRQTTLSIRWILASCRSKRNAPMAKKLANELIMAANGEGPAIKKREDVIKMAQANKAFAHYAKY